MSIQDERVIVYIDGFNLYFGLRAKGWYKYYWLNMKTFAESLLIPDQTLVHTKYFTSKVSRPEAKRKRQAAYLSALSTLTGLSIYYGRYQSISESCQHCGHTYTTSNEKKTDVNIATHMLVDVFQDRFDTAILVSADSDLVSPISEILRLFPHKYVKVAFPPERSSFELKNTAPTSFTIYEKKFRKNQFPDQVQLPSGFIVKRPGKWR
ncbi:MAG: NYN domain-containing protein [Anaerolineales bacterium]